MALFFNQSGFIGTLIIYTTTNITGSLFLTMLLYVLTVFAILQMLRVPIEFSVVLVLPTIITLMAFMGEFIALGGVLLIYLAILVVRMFFIN